MMEHAVIIAGGRGERFWPRSRIDHPKQLLCLFSEKPMILETVERIEKLIPRERIWIVALKEQEEGIRKAVSGVNFIFEPEGRNTAPAIGYAAVHLSDEDIMVVLPSDHYIGTVDKFLTCVKEAINLAEKGFLVTFGIVPTRPETGYGYIEVGKKLTDKSYKVASFKEKPNFRQAQEFLKSGKYLWNSGMFVWKVKVILSEIKKYLPDLYSGLMEIKKGGDPIKFYPKFPKISIDYGVMERSDRVAVIRADFSWDDVGSWTSLERIYDKDEDGNIKLGDAVLLDTRDTIVYSSDGIIATLGVNNLIVIRSGDAVLVCDKSKAQEVKRIVSELSKQEKFRKYL